MERSVKDLLGGGRKPNDPRRFLIEAMVAAMSSDGHIDPRESAQMEKIIEEHPLFGGLGARSSKTLVELSTDAIRFAGGAVGRAPAIAKGLPARIHRLAASGRPRECAFADEQLLPGELSFLEALRIALRIAPSEGEEVIHA